MGFYLATIALTGGLVALIGAVNMLAIECRTERERKRYPPLVASHMRRERAGRAYGG